MSIESNGTDGPDGRTDPSGDAAPDPLENAETGKQQQQVGKRWVVFTASLIAAALVVVAGAVILVLWLAAERHWLQITNVVLSWDTPTDEIRVAVDADGDSFSFPRTAEWARVMSDLPEERFLLRRWRREYKLAFEISRKDGARYLSEPEIVPAAPGEKTVELFLAGRPGKGSRRADARLTFEIKSTAEARVAGK